MSEEPKRDPARGWRFAEKLMAEEDDERFLAMTPDERRAEIAKLGPPAPPFSVDDLMAGAAAKLAERKAAAANAAANAPAVVPAVVPSVAPPASVPPASVAPASVPPASAPPVAPAPSGPPSASAKVVPIRGRWVRPVALLGTLAAGYFVYLVNRPPDPVGSARPDPIAKAERIRDRAEAFCAAKDWDACERALDHAESLDLAGEVEPRVTQARMAIAAARATALDGGR